MDADGLASVQEDQELAATPEDIARIAATEALVDVHTCLPGIVKSFDPKTQTAKVQPAIMRLWRDGGWKPLPECVDCPVSMPRYGNFVITGPVSPGDEGLLKFSERSIDNWWARGGVQEQSEMRMHDLSDGFFEPGYSSKGRVPANVSTDGLEIRTLDGKTMFRLEGDTAYQGAKAGAQKAVMGEIYRSQEDLLFQSLSSFASALVSACTGVVTIGQAAVAINAIGPAASPLVDAIAAFEGQKAAYLAEKAKVA